MYSGLRLFNTVFVNTRRQICLKNLADASAIKKELIIEKCYGKRTDF